MRYGQTSHDKDKEFEDDIEEELESIKEIPRRKGSLLPSMNFKSSIPDTMSEMNKFDTSFSSHHSPVSIHNSTPYKTNLPRTKGGMTFGHNSMRVLDTEGLPKIGNFKKKR